MFIRHWIIAVAFGLVLSAGLGQAQEQTQNEQGQAAAQQNPPQTFSIPIHIVEDEAAAKARESIESETRQHNKDDLVAQQGMNRATVAMNDATQRMAEYSFWSILLVGLGTLLLIVTLWLTRLANKAAQAAVDVTREIGEKQLRAYISYSEMSVAGVADRDTIQERTGYMFSPYFKNFGQTPARETRVTSWCRAMQIGQIPPRITIGDEPHPHQYEGSQVGPGDAVSGNPQIFSVDDIIASLNEEKALTVSARVDYEDIFGVNRTSECCILIMVVCDEEYLRKDKINVLRAFKFSMYGPNNTGD